MSTAARPRGRLLEVVAAELQRIITSARRLLVIEIADSSIDDDRDVKAPLDARAGVHEYWLADRDENIVCRYRSPERGSYQRIEVFTRDQTIAPLELLTCAIAVDARLTE